jgi:Fe-S-cluster containining protein
MHRKEVEKHIAKGTNPWTGDYDGQPLPFMHPVRIATRYAHRGARKPHSVKWGFECERLGADGRCTQYEDRPNMCRIYEPKDDLLCIEFDGSYKGCLNLYLEEENDDGDED